MFAAFFGGTHASFGAFADILALELCKDRELTIEHASNGGSGIDALCEGLEIHTAIPQIAE